MFTVLCAGSTPASRTKKKVTTKVVTFFLGFGCHWPPSLFGIKMLGAGKAAPAASASASDETSEGPGQAQKAAQN